MQFPSWELRSLSWALVITPPNNGLADGAPVTPKSKARPNQNITGTYIAESPNLYLFHFLAAELYSKHRAPPGSRKVFEYFWIFIFHLLSKYKRQRKSQAKNNIENNHLFMSRSVWLQHSKYLQQVLFLKTTAKYVIFCVILQSFINTSSMFKYQKFLNYIKTSFWRS